MAYNDYLGPTIAAPRPQLPPAGSPSASPGHGGPRPGDRVVMRPGFSSNTPANGGPMARPVHGNLPPPGYGYAPVQQRPDDATNLATLSMVFAFVFAPIGIVLGHMALNRLRWPNQPGQGRAIAALLFSYAILLIAVVALIVSLATASSGNRPQSQATSATSTTVAPETTTTTTKRTPSSTPRTTIVTTPPVIPPSTTPSTVSVEDLRVGDCVNIEKVRADPANPGLEFIKIYASACVAGATVYRVDQIVTRAGVCPQTFLVNRSETVYACVSKFNR
jgi:hypothetical protein